jgi:uncharacterized protein (DUF1778 family)
MAIIIRMARPRKPDSERKAIILRIPVTEEQQSLIVEAAARNGADMATWARPVLLQAARRAVAKRNVNGDQSIKHPGARRA